MSAPIEWSVPVFPGVKVQRPGIQKKEDLEEVEVSGKLASRLTSRATYHVLSD